MPQIQLDEIDLDILIKLARDGRKSYKDIAAELGISAGTVRNRVTRLVEQKTLSFIGGIDPNHVGFHAFATIHIRVSPTKLIQSVVDQLLELPEVGFLATVAGEYDLHADVMCVNNDHLTELLHEHIDHIEGIVDTKTTIVLRVHGFGQPDLALLKKGVDGGETVGQL